MDKGRPALIEEAEGVTEAEKAEEEEWEEASLLPLGAPLSCFRPTMASQCGPSPPDCATHAEWAGACVCVCGGGGVRWCVGVCAGCVEGVEKKHDAAKAV